MLKHQLEVLFGYRDDAVVINLKWSASAKALRRGTRTLSSSSSSSPSPPYFTCCAPEGHNAALGKFPYSIFARLCLPRQKLNPTFHTENTAHNLPWEHLSLSFRYYSHIKYSKISPHPSPLILGQSRVYTSLVLNLGLGPTSVGQRREKGIEAICIQNQAIISSFSRTMM